ncbi:MAG TPA: HdeA/HdeB family chaperone [Azonexus sp.]
MQTTGFTRLAVAAAVSFGLAAAPATAQNVLGFDDMSCAAWSASKGDSDQRAAYVVWVRGFLSGHNYALPKQQVSTISSGTIENHLNRYCASNPRGSFSDGAMRLSDQFSGRNQPVRK